MNFSKILVQKSDTINFVSIYVTLFFSYNAVKKNHANYSIFWCWFSYFFYSSVFFLVKCQKLKW